MRFVRSVVGWMAVGALIGACGGGPEPNVPTFGDEDEGGETPAVTPRPAGGDPNAPSVQAEVGALDGKAVDEVATRVRKKAKRCFSRANDGLPFPVVYGDVELTVRVKSDGSVRWVFPSKSDVGHHAVADCIADLLRAESWPKPEGGQEGIARTSYGRDPEGRAPVSWSDGDLGGEGQALRGALSACKRRHGAGKLTFTMYVDADGKVMAADAAVDEGEAADAVGCAVDAAKGKTFPSPGSFPAKVSLEL